jgi:endo-1,4-beta-xylanase
MTRTRLLQRIFAAGAVLLLLGMTGARVGAEESEPPYPTTLRDAAPEGFRIGTAVSDTALQNDAQYRAVLAREFNSVTAENVMKWQTLQPQRGQFNFAPGDRLVKFAEDNDMDVYGHVLVWHSQLPGWVTSGNFSADELRQILKTHIQTVVRHYKGRISRWDVVNEAVADGGGMRSSVFYNTLGESFIADSIRWAHEADPDAELFINDYNVDFMTGNAKSTTYYELAQRLVAQGVPLTGMGFQGHLSVNGYYSSSREPVNPIDMAANARRFTDLGLKVAITEADVGMPLPDAGTDALVTATQLAQFGSRSVRLSAQAYVYSAMVETCLHAGGPGCDTFTVWGFTDNHSWIPQHRTGWGGATLFDTAYQPKAAYHQMLAALHRAARARG